MYLWSSSSRQEVIWGAMGAWLDCPPQEEEELRPHWAVPRAQIPTLQLGLGHGIILPGFWGCSEGGSAWLSSAQCSPARRGHASTVAQHCRNVEQQVVPGRAVRAGEGTPLWPLVAVLGLLCPCPCL